MSDMSNEPQSQVPAATPQAASSEPAPQTTVPPPAPDKMQSEARMWAMFAHLAALAGLVVPFFGNILGPLVVWLVKKDEFPLVDDQGKESLNFQITMTIGLIVSAILMVVGIGLILIPLVGLTDLVFVIIASVEVNNKGTPYRYPFAIRLVK